MNVRNTTYIALVLVILGWGVQRVDAAEVTFKVVPGATEQDTATIVEAYIDPKGESLNAVEGVIGFSGPGVSNVSSVVVETGGSLFTLWPVLPTYSNDENVIRFTGGATEEILDTGLLFRMRIFSTKAGDVSLSWLGGSLYRSDGEGTPVGVSSRSLAISLAQNEPNQINPASLDSNPPYFTDITISKDEDVFGGKYFLSFNANDDISGIARYEVVEGQVTTEVKNGVYVLQDQEQKLKIVVIAYDNAGNSISTKVLRHPEWLPVAIGIGVIILISVLGFLIRRGHRRRKVIKQRSS